jgi:hypothetical protein
VTTEQAASTEAKTDIFTSPSMFSDEAVPVRRNIMIPATELAHTNNARNKKASWNKNFFLVFQLLVFRGGGFL